MMQKKHLHLIIHQHNAPEDGLIRRSFRVYTNSVRKSFTDYCELDEDSKSNIEARIHVARTNIFSELQDLTKNVSNANKQELIVEHEGNNVQLSF